MPKSLCVVLARELAAVVCSPQTNVYSPVPIVIFTAGLYAPVIGGNEARIADEIVVVNGVEPILIVAADPPPDFDLERS